MGNQEPYQEVLASFPGQTIKLLVNPRSFWFLQEDPGCILSLTGQLFFIIDPFRILNVKSGVLQLTEDKILSHIRLIGKNIFLSCPLQSNSHPNPSYRISIYNSIIIKYTNNE